VSAQVAETKCSGFRVAANVAKSVLSYRHVLDKLKEHEDAVAAIIEDRLTQLKEGEELRAGMVRGNETHACTDDAVDVSHSWVSVLTERCPPCRDLRGGSHSQMLASGASASAGEGRHGPCQRRYARCGRRCSSRDRRGRRWAARRPSLGTRRRVAGRRLGLTPQRSSLKCVPSSLRVSAC